MISKAKKEQDKCIEVQHMPKITKLNRFQCNHMFHPYLIP